MFLPFSPPPGLNSDDTSFSSEGRWADGDNVRFHLGRAQPVGTAATGGFDALPSGVVNTDIFAFTRAGTSTFVYGCAGTSTNVLLVASALGAPADRSPASAHDSSSGWSFASWGDTLLACQRGGTLYDQTSTNAAAAVANAPDQIDAGILVTPERQVLAFGCNEESSGTHNPLCIRGSDLEDYTDWTTSATNNAFEHILDGPGKIIAAKQVGPYVAVWTTTALWLGQFVGDPSQAYRFDKVAEGVGPMSPRSVAVLDGVAWWMGIDFKLRAWAPGGLPAAIPCPISREFIENADSPDRPRDFLVANTRWQEVWLFHQDERESPTDTPTRYIAYSVRESALARSPVWFRGALERTAAIDSEIVGIEAGASQASLLSVNAAGTVTLIDIGTSGHSGAYIQSAGLYLDNSQRRVMIRGCRPDFEELGASTSTVNLSLLMRDYPQGSAVTKGPHALTTATTKKDFRASGKIAEVKLESSGNASWRLGKLLFDVVPMGMR